MLGKEYAKRRDMQEIIPGLFLGPYAVAKKDQLQYLQGNGITHIVCVRCPMEAKIIKPNFPEQVKYLVIEIADKNSQNIIQYFQQVKHFIDECLCMQGKVLVHGSVGFSRSPSLVIGYLMESFKIPFLDALRYVCERRPCCSPNLGFQRQLEEYEHIIMAKEEVSEHRKENLYSQQMVEVLIVGSDTHLHIISDPEHR
ncbi:putative serine/threonine/tyrosine-interacting protein [Apostichopus japonicus]|uniref:Putative serine/threonine/tyrosine-interacting protein n=1 Tax=Stichopus japonicus TaxID=307972 RepID=A0A2G8LDF8_STIJA|nr:putative serine/threonine/tyrosine-interacting protein [Apostichopus japonicus]